MIDDLISKYVQESAKTRARMQSKLFSIFTETTGHRPEDLCLVEQQIKKDVGDSIFTTMYFFDLKHRYQSVHPSSYQSQLSETQRKLGVAVEALTNLKEDWDRTMDTKINWSDSDIIAPMRGKSVWRACQFLAEIQKGEG